MKTTLIFSGNTRIFFKRYQPACILRSIILLACLGQVLLTCSNSKAQGTWTALSNAAPNANGGILIPLPDGTILARTAAGGGVGKTFNRLSPTLSNSYQAGTWTSIAPMMNDRKRFSSQMLKNGKLYVAGGETGAGGALGEIYTLETNTWSATGSPGATISDANSEILDNGKVLQFFGTVSSHTCKLYDPATNTYSNAANSNGIHTDATIHKLNDGSVLLIDRVVGSGSVNTERYFPATDTWALGPGIPFEMYSSFGSSIGASIMLPDGRIFIVGGNGNTAIYTQGTTSSQPSWAAGPSIPGGYAQPDGPIAIGRDGIVLFTASPIPINGNTHQDPTRFYEYNYITNTITQINGPTGLTLPANTSNETHLVNLANGQILLGIEGSTQYYLYTPAGSNLTAYRGTTTDHDATCDHFIVYGTKFNGKSLGSGEGGEGQNSSNFPIIRLSSGPTVYFCRSFNWNSTLMNRTGADTVEFEVPVGIPNGTYNLAMICNGVNSLNTYSFTTYPQLTSATSATICSETNFSYTPTFDRGCVTASWTRAAVAGISNAAITTPQAGSINETLNNTTTTAKIVTYAYIISNQGFADTVNITVTVNPKPTVSVTPASFCVSGMNTTLTASGANTYAWTPGTTGATQVVNPSSYTIYRVIGTNGSGCTDTAFSTAHELAAVSATALDTDLCPGQTTTLNAVANANFNGTLATTLATNTNSNANVFNVQANSTISIQAVKMQINMVGGMVACQVWYKPGGYGNANLTNSAGWTQIGSTINVSGAGLGAYTTIPLPTALTIPAGQTYGLVVSCNTLSTSLISTDPPGTVFTSNVDLSISVGHLGSTVLGGAFNFTTSQRVWSGEIEYIRPGTIMSYSWSPSATLSNANTATPIANPVSNTTYTVTVTDGNLCTNTSSVTVNRHANPTITSISSTPSTICEGGSSTVSVNVNASTFQWQPFNLIQGANTLSNANVMPAVTSTFTVTATDAFGCSVTGTTMVGVNKIPTATVSVTPSPVCISDSATVNLTPILAPTNQLDSLTSTASSNGATNGKVFNVVAIKGIEIKKLKLDLAATVTQLEIWYKPGGYGSTTFTGTSGWTQVPIVGAVNSQGTGNLTTITLSSNIIVPQGQTYGIMIAANGSIFSAITGGTAGSVFVSNADLSITRGHTGSGIGAYVFNGAIGVQKGAILYSETNSIITSAWTPTNDLLSTTGLSNKATPNTSTVYTVTLTDNNACSNTVTVPVRVHSDLIGTATASPATICTGNQVTLTYTQPSGQQCWGIPHFDFSTPYAPSNWTTTLTNAIGGNVNTSLAPNQITINGSSGLTEGFTAYTVTVPCTGIISFHWSTNNTGTSSQFDYPMYSVNGGTKILMPGYLLGEGFPVIQSGDFNLLVTAGSTFSIIMRNEFSFATGSITISNFVAPKQTIATQFVNWFTAPSGGTLVGITPTSTTTTGAAGNQTYYAEVTTAPGGCLHLPRIPTNLVTINPGLTVTVGSTVNPVCEGGSTILTATGGVSYTWMPGNLTGTSITVSPTTATTYTVTGTGANGCTNTSTITIGVSQKPVITGGATPGIVCPGGAVTLSGTTSNVTWNWMPGNLSGSPVTVNPMVQTTYTVTATNANGCTATETFVVLMHSTPNVSVSASPSSTVCAGTAVTLTASGAASYVWSPGNLLGASIITAVANTYTVTGTSSQGCTGTAVQTIIVNPLPTVNASASSTTICLGSATSLNVSGNAVSYVWNPGNLNGALVSVSPTVATTYTVTGTNASGCTATSTVMINVNSLPVISGSVSPGTVCPGANVTLTGTTPNLTWVWQPGNLAGSTQVVNPTLTTTYTVTATNAQGCTKTQTFLVSVHPAPNLNILASPSSSICIGSTVSLTASGATSYLWQPGNSTAATINVTPFSTTTYTVTGTNAQGCTSIATQTIIVTMPPVTATASSTSLCTGNSLTLTANGASTYNWQPGNLSGSSVSVSPTSTTTFTVIGTDVNGCTSGSILNINVFQSPNFTTVSAQPPLVCVGGTSALHSSIGESVQSMIWQPGNISSGGIALVNPTVTTTYTCTAVDVEGCSTATTLTVVVDPNPAITISASPSTTICFGTSVTLTASGANTYNWQPGNFNGGPIFTVTPFTTTTYTVTGTLSQGCTVTSTITINPDPQIAVTSSVNPLCTGNSATLTASGAATYVWQPGNLTGSSVMVSPNAQTIYTVTGTSASGCTNATLFNLQVNQSPTMTLASAIPSSSCPGQSVVLNSSIGAPVQSMIWQPGNISSGGSISVTPTASTIYTVTATATNGCTTSSTVMVTVNQVSATSSNINICNGNSNLLTASGANTYVWNPGGLSGSMISVSPTVTTTYTVTGTTANGCTSTSTVAVSVLQNCAGVKNIKLFIEGYYAGGNLMNAVLLNQGVAGATASECDTITVELRLPNSPSTVVKTKKVVLQTDGTAFVNFGTTGLYYLVIKHRNGLETWSAAPVSVTVASSTYDFSTAANKAYGDNQSEVESGVWAIFSGDIVADENIDLLDLGMLENDISNFAFGFFATDINGDGNVDLLDNPVLESNVNNFVFSVHP